MHQITERLIQARGGERGSGITVSTEDLRKHSPCAGAKKGGRNFELCCRKDERAEFQPCFSITDLRKLIQHLTSSISPP